MRLANWYPDRIDGVVFDMDGVLADTEPIHGLAFLDVLAEYGAVATSEDYLWTVGRGSNEIWQGVRDRWQIADSIQILATSFERYLLPRLLHVVPAPGAIAFVEDLRCAGVPIALASSSSRRIVDQTLRVLGLEAAFAATIAGSEGGPPKPHPAIYLAAAAGLGAGAARCVAIEDSVPGMESARAAGMTVVAIRNRYLEGEPPADVVIDSLEQLIS